jgi:hypothetical protein
MSNGTLYDQDAFLWSQRQAALLRELARAGALPTGLDWPNITEEIESVGRSELNTVRSHLYGLMLRLIKAASATDSEKRDEWLEQAATCRMEADLRYTPGMREQIDLGKLWREARHDAAAWFLRYEERMAPVPEEVPFALDELMGDIVAAAEVVWRLSSERIAEGR